MRRRAPRAPSVAPEARASRFATLVLAASCAFPALGCVRARKDSGVASAKGNTGARDPASQSGKCPSLPALPNAFHVKKRPINGATFWTSALDVLPGLKGAQGATTSALATLMEPPISLRQTFQLTVPGGALVAEGRKAIFSWSTKIDVYDCDKETRIGHVQQTLQSAVTQGAAGGTTAAVSGSAGLGGMVGRIWTTYEIADATGKVVAEARKFDLAKVRFDLVRPGAPGGAVGGENAKAGAPLATIERSFFQAGIVDDWSVTLHEPAALDMRLVLMIPAFKTDADATRAAQEALEALDGMANSRSSGRGGAPGTGSGSDRRPK